LPARATPRSPSRRAAARLFTSRWNNPYNPRGLYEPPVLPAEDGERGPDRTRAAGILRAALGAGRTLLTEAESKQLLAAYRLPVVATFVAADADEAVRRAGEIGYPVVLKLHSETVTHQTDLGGLRLNL